MIANGCGPGMMPEVETQPVEHQGPHVHGVEQGQEGDHPAGDDPRLEPRAPQRPGRQRDPAGARGGEQARGREPGHRDLVALAPADSRLAADEHGSEQRDVAAERQDLEHRRAGEPPRVPALDPVPRVLQAEQLREHEVQEGDRGDDEQQRGEQAPAREANARHLLDRTAAVRGVVVAPPQCQLLRALDHAPDVRCPRSLLRAGFVVHPAPSLANRASSTVERADEPPRQRRGARREQANGLGQRAPGQDVSDVVLAQIDERQRQRPRICPAERARDGTDLREQTCPHQRRSEVKRRHGSKRISSEDIVEGRPAVSPELLPVFDHHSPHRDGLADALQAPVPHRIPRRRGRNHPVEHGAQVEHRVHPRGRGGEPLRPARQHIQDRAVGNHEPHPVAPDQHALERAEAPGGRERPLEAHGRRHAEPDHRVDVDRIVDPDPLGQAVRVVVRHLVRRQVRPHVQRADACLAQPPARHRDAQRDRGERGAREHRGRAAA